MIDLTISNPSAEIAGRYGHGMTFILSHGQVGLLHKSDIQENTSSAGITLLVNLLWYEQTCLTSDIETGNSPSEEQRECHTCIFCQKGKRRGFVGSRRCFICWWACFLSRPQYKAKRPFKLTLQSLWFTSSVENKKAVLSIFTDWYDDIDKIVNMCDETAGSRVWKMYAITPGARWSTIPGITLIGDSAHLMTPFAGEGVNMVGSYERLSLSDLRWIRGVPFITS